MISEANSFNTDSDVLKRIKNGEKMIDFFSLQPKASKAVDAEVKRLTEKINNVQINPKRDILSYIKLGNIFFKTSDSLDDYFNDIKVYNELSNRELEKVINTDSY